MRRKLKAAMAIIGVMTPFLAQADQPMNSNMNSNSSSKAQVYAPGEMVRDGQLPAGYNQSASYSLDGGWDVFFTGNFIYWHLNQDESAMGTLLTTTPGSTGAAVANGSGSDQYVGTTYKPGFQVGLGFNMKGMDNWNLYAGYTWYKNSASKTVTPGAGQLFVIPAGPIADDMVSVSSATGNSNFHYNDANLSFQRAFYWGKKLTSEFGCGLRARWINQKASQEATAIGYSDVDAVAITAAAGTVNSSYKQSSWALGPRFSLDSNWLLGYGFRVMGDVAASVLYTRYTELNSSYSNTQKAVTRATANYSKDGATLGTIRPVTESALGLGWGSYFGDNDDFHFDLTASYEFDIHWNQNMNNGATPGNIYIHGLNVGLRLDF